LKNILKHKIMGYIQEPKGVDFIIKSPPLTQTDKEEISDFIQKYKSQPKRKIVVRNRQRTNA